MLSLTGTFEQPHRNLPLPTPPLFRNICTGETPNPPRAAAFQRAVPRPPAVSAGLQLHADVAVLRDEVEPHAGTAAAGVPKPDERHAHGPGPWDGLQRLRSFVVVGPLHVHVLQGARGRRHTCDDTTAAAVLSKRKQL